MQITDGNELLGIADNEFIGKVPELINSQINFNGVNNILVCEENVKLLNSRIDFNSENSILYLSKSIHDYCVNISIHKNNVCFIGKDNYFNGQTNIILSESKNVIIGDNNLFSYHISIRVADGHLIYNSKTKKRINHSKSIYIGDHIWLGQDTLIFKGTQIGSGAIIGANSFLSNKLIPSNTTFGGNLPKLIHEDTFWTGHSVHGWGEEDTQKMETYESDKFIYEIDQDTLEFDEIEYNFNNFPNKYSIIMYIESYFLDAGKNRFALKK